MENQTPSPPERPQQPPPVYHRPYEKPPSNPFEKTPFLAGILSVVPGLGNIYNGLYLRGLAFALVCIGLFLIAILEEAPPLIPFILFFWLFNVIDAYRQAMLINYGAPTEELDPARRPEWQSSGGIILGVALSLVGAYGLITKLFPSFDLSELLEYWWVAFLVLGPWLIYKTIQERGRKDDGSEGPTATSSASQDDEMAA
jgi:hypothetical protein